MKEIYDVCIIGAGPSGMMAAIQAGQKSLNVIVLEKKSRPGLKLSITGKGRCNITNSASIKEFVDLFYNGKFLYSSFHAFSNIDVISFFESLNVPCKLERGGRYFPVSDKACDVVNALVKTVKKFAKVASSFKVKSAKQDDNGIFCISGNFYVYARNLIIASGGMSYPATGSSGDGYRFAESFGHSIKKPIAALVPIVLESKYLNELKGLKLKNVEVSLEVSNKIILKEFGEMEFTSFGADGSVILTISSLVSLNMDKGNNINLKINLKPAVSQECLNVRLLKEINKFGQYQVKDMIKEFLPIQFIKPFLNYCGINITKKCSQLTKFDREKMLNTFFEISFKILSTKDIKDAIVTRGGILTNEINQKTMESKFINGLYFCGEVIDVDAPTGGFNLQAAFSTGFVAGTSVYRS
ncbi:MAG: NAD(P)/FAD-dependent oxidoreductase [Endomicrobium sp.]|jgi:predicted Rossmann fold flavoprotein|nr:NAD(P)/FAD-dependent oxidoreductase [Endomicrobium sp.]